MNAALLLSASRILRSPRRLFCLLLFVPLLAHAQPATLQQQRDAFRAAYTAAYNGQDWRPLAQGLENYPLYPYLEAAALEHDLAHADRAQVAAYLARYPDLIPAQDLRRDELTLLAKQQDWNGFVSFYQPGLGDALACDALQAKLARGGKLDFQKDLAALWDKPSLPPECASVLDAANAQGLLNTQRIWARIDRAADAHAPSTIEQSAAWLSSDDAAIAMRLADALRSPASFLKGADKLPDGARTRQALTIALTRYARSDDDAAQVAWQRLAPHFAFDGAQRDRILAALAIYSATDGEPGALAMLAALPASAQTDTTREWRVRAALAQQDWTAAQAAIAALTPQQMERDEWRYWHARIAQKLGHEQQAQAEYATLARHAGYYAFLAADRAGLPYTICPQSLTTDAAAQQRLLGMPGFARAFELFALDMLQPARREWNRAFDGLDNYDRRQVAALAYARGWYDRAVFALANDDDSRFYEQRFPLAEEPNVLASAQAAGIDPVWAYAIIRAESAWQTDAHSGANAYGLMQLVPATAAQLARESGLPYGNAQDLYDPAINIPLGTRYLAAMAMRYDGSPWLASAAYNAGPIPVQRWVDLRGSLEPDVFIATIPYKETRDYVGRVLSFETMYDWRMHGDALPITSRMPAIGTGFALPVAVTRKSVVCNLDSDTRAAAAASTGAAPAIGKGAH
ncbi:MAG TPA: transglycosylase SLT domain-containing protein [Rhodanobacteraceae bacterium]|nr:transglycosylase SLT domain-containing protein [Rhodanobacteraceae bacterium]